MLCSTFLQILTKRRLRQKDVELLYSNRMQEWIKEAHSGTESPAESAALAMHTGEATFFLASFTLFKLVVNGVNAKPRATTGFARNEDRSAGNLALIWLGERHTWTLCTPQADLAELLTPEAPFELDRAWNSVTFEPTPSATDADAAMATPAFGDAQAQIAIASQQTTRPKSFLNLSISRPHRTLLPPPSDLALLRPGAGGWPPGIHVTRPVPSRHSPVPNLRSTRYSSVQSTLDKCYTYKR